MSRDCVPGEQRRERHILKSPEGPQLHLALVNLYLFQKSPSLSSVAGSVHNSGAMATGFTQLSRGSGVCLAWCDPSSSCVTRQ